MVKVSNNPAKLKSISHKHYILINGEENILDDFQSRYVIYPGDMQEYTYTFAALLDRMSEQPKEVCIYRKVDVVYQALAGGKDYKYELLSKLEPSEPTWKKESETAS